MFASLLATAVLHVLPRPAHVRLGPCAIAVQGTVPRSIDPAALEELRSRWSALGVARVRTSPDPQVRFVRNAALGAQAYRLVVDSGGIRIASSTPDGAFYGAMTLAQLPQRSGGRWVLPCVTIDDAPAMRWRILSDDVSRGPIPTKAYFERRIRTIAAFKMNGYSPYMESVVETPADPLPAQPDGITPAQLSQLARYASRYHVAFIPQQQTFAHMHGTLRIETYASAAALPHGFLLDPGNAVASGYLARTIRAELAAVPHPPFFHIGSDETGTLLGEGTSAAYVNAHGGRGAVYAAHVREMNALIAPSGARVMLWDDGIQADPAILAHIPRSAVIVSWHYGVEPSYVKYIDTIARAGFDQMVDPGDANWNQLFPDLNSTLTVSDRFIGEAKRARVLGLYESVWHDDGETLFESTWYPVLYAAADAWSTSDGFAADFPYAFFGSSDAGLARDAAVLGSLDARLPAPSDRVFWSDPFDAASFASMQNVDLRALRLDAESVETHLLHARPPLQRGAADAMLLAARRYDALGRRYQIAREARAYYADASSGSPDAVRDLFWVKYWFWEMRDTDERLAIDYARAWNRENRPDHLASNLERYHLDAQTAIRRADAVDRVTYEDAVAHKPLPPFDSLLGESP